MNGTFQIILVLFLGALGSLRANYCPESISEQYGHREYAVAAAYAEGMHAYDERNYEAAVQNWELVVEAAVENKDYELLYCLYPKLANAHGAIGSYQDAIGISLNFLALPNADQDLSRLSARHAYLSDYYCRISQWEDAMTHFLEAKETASRAKDTLSLTQAYYQGGVVNHYLKQYTVALRHYEKALVLALAQKNKGAALACFTALASSAEAMGNLPQALSYAHASAQTFEDRQRKGYSLQNMGTIYQRMGMYDSAAHYLHQAYAIFRLEEDAWAQARTANFLGQLAVDRGRPDSAIFYFESIIENPDYRRYPISLSAYKGMAKAHEALDQAGEAIQYWESYITLQESFYQDTLQLKLDELSARYELKQREADLALLHKEVEVNRLQKSLYGGGVAALIIVVLGMVWANRALRKNQQLLAEKNRQIEAQYHQLQDYNQRLKRFNQIVSHDLKQPLRTIQSFVGLLNKRYNQLLPEGAQEYMGFIKQNTTQMYELIEGLLSLSQLEKDQTAEHRWIRSQGIADKALTQLQQLIHEKQAKINYLPPSDWPEIKGHPAQLTQLWQNLIGNALKFSPKGEVRIVLGYQARGEQHVFFVQDNGIGISEEDQQRIFEMFSRLHNRRDYEGHGIGLATCKKIVELHGGRIWVESTPGEGSTFFFSLRAHRISRAQPSSTLTPA